MNDVYVLKVSYFKKLNKINYNTDTMKKKIFLFSFLIFSLFMIQAQTKSIHQFKVEDINGDTFDLSSLKGKKVLIVNVASKCGFTPQYEQLQELYDKYKDSDFMVIGFPANDFANQEPGSNAEIKAFCTENYGVTFPMMGKISTKGDNQSPVYEWLTHKSMNGVSDSEVSWNFQKYMIDKEGKLVDFVSPKENPMSDKIISWIEDNN
jgi:glutathione peroxidase